MIGPPTPIGPAAPKRSGPPLVRESVPTAAESGGSPSANPSDFVLFRNTDLGTGHGSLINEPSAGSNGAGILETWNWYAAASTNGGASFSYINPYTTFPASYGGFCCDQLAYYVPSRDIYIWILQYSEDASNNNAERLAVAKGQAGLASGTWTYWDLTPQQIGSSNGTNYDRGKIAASSNYLFLEASQYGNVLQQGASVMMRFSLDQLASTPATLTYDFYPTLFSSVPTENATSTMYFAAHVSQSVLRLYSWPESVDHTGVTFTDITHPAYSATLPYTCPRTGAPASSDWCQRPGSGGGYAHDDRMQYGWVASGKIGFVWDASQGNNQGLGNFPYPYVYAIRVNESTKTLLDEPVIWNPNFAFSYASVAPNDRGDLGGTVMWGGGNTFENCAALIWDGFSPNNFWQLAGAESSDSDTRSPTGGDFTTARRNGGNDHVWSGACYALKGGGGELNTHTYYFSFGRQQDSPVTHRAVADFDGNGATDVSVYRPSTGVWYVRNQFSVTWGVSTDIPVPGDYNGDGKTDVAVYRPSTGVWYVRNQFSVTWGVSTDIPLPLPNAISQVPRCGVTRRQVRRLLRPW